MAETNLIKNKQGYGYKYTDLAQIHEYLEQNNMKYYQYIEALDGKDYIVTVPIIDGKEMQHRRGVQIVNATLNGMKNPAQEQGSATTYARRYSLLMAFGLATEDDDGASLTNPQKSTKEDVDTNKKISKTQEEAIDKAIENRKISDEIVLEILEKYGYSNTSEIQIKNYKQIVNDFQKVVQK